jgi:hypothetical protein
LLSANGRNGRANARGVGCSAPRARREIAIASGGAGESLKAATNRTLPQRKWIAARRPQ